MHTPQLVAEPFQPSPATRDRYLDALRAACIAVVVTWHWVFTTVAWRSDGPHVGNPVPQIPGGWLLTWLIQPMPLFFLIGGHLNGRSLERSGNSRRWVHSRLRSLLAPAVPLIGVFAAAQIAVRAFVPGHGIERALILVVSPLWFLAVYVVCIAMAPLALAAHRRHPAIAFAVLGGAALVLDVLRFGLGRSGWWSLLSMIAVWGLIHQVGLAGWDWASASVRRGRQLLIGGYTALAVAVVAGPYAPEMVGVPGKQSNFAPASLVIVALAVAHLGAAVLLKDRIEGVLARHAGLGAKVARVNRQAMTIFVWHLPVWAASYVVLRVADLPIPATPTAVWWLTRPVWLVVPLAGLVRVLGRPEPRS